MDRGLLAGLGVVDSVGRLSLYGFFFLNHHSADFVAWAHSHKRNSTQRKEVVDENWEGAEQLLNQLVAFALVKNIFLLPLFFIYRVDVKRTVFLERDSSLLFCTPINEAPVLAKQS